MGHLCTWSSSALPEERCASVSTTAASACWLRARGRRRCQRTFGRAGGREHRPGPGPSAWTCRPSPSFRADVRVLSESTGPAWPSTTSSSRWPKAPWLTPSPAHGTPASTRRHRTCCCSPARSRATSPWSRSTCPVGRWWPRAGSRRGPSGPTRTPGPATPSWARARASSPARRGAAVVPAPRTSTWSPPPGTRRVAIVLFHTASARFPSDAATLQGTSDKCANELVGHRGPQRPEQHQGRVGQRRVGGAPQPRRGEGRQRRGRPGQRGAGRVLRSFFENANNVSWSA